MRKLEMQEYQPEWKYMYEKERIKVEKILENQVINAFHIGSTAIENLCAKPTIDILIEVKDINEIDTYNHSLKEIGYIACGENGIAGRRYFYKEEDNHHLFHIHIFELGNTEIKKHLVFRNYIRKHENIKNEYATLKKEIVSKNVSITQYQDLKADFIHKYTTLALEEFKNYYPVIRKKGKIILKKEAYEIMKKINYGTLAISNDFPYAIALNHVLIDENIYFHTGSIGYKLNGLNKEVCFTVIHDLGLKEEASTNNYESVMVFGKLVECNDKKVEVLTQIMKDLAPSQTIMDKETMNKIPMNILRIEVDVIYGKRHIK